MRLTSWRLRVVVSRTGAFQPGWRARRDQWFALSLRWLLVCGYRIPEVVEP